VPNGSKAQRTAANSGGRPDVCFRLASFAVCGYLARSRKRTGKACLARFKESPPSAQEIALAFVAYKTTTT
jgi:hypothetical protein